MPAWRRRRVVWFAYFQASLTRKQICGPESGQRSQLPAVGTASEPDVISFLLEIQTDQAIRSRIVWNCRRGRWVRRPPSNSGARLVILKTPQRLRPRNEARVMRRTRNVFLFAAFVIAGCLFAPLLFSNWELMKGEKRALAAAREIHRGVEATRNERKVDHAKRFEGWSLRDLRINVKRELESKDLIEHIGTSPGLSLWVYPDTWSEASPARKAASTSLVWELFFRSRPGNTSLPIFEFGTKRHVANYSPDSGLADLPRS